MNNFAVMVNSKMRALATVLLFVMVSSGVPAQESPAAATVADPDVPKDQLALLVRPLTKDELVVEADAWLELLRAKTAENSRGQIAQLRDDAAAPDDATLVQLQGEQEALAERLKVVFSELEKKGGDPADYEAYANSVVATFTDKVDPRKLSRVYAELRLIVQEKGLSWAIDWGMNILLFLGVIFFFVILSRVVGGLVNKAVGAAKTVPNLLRNFIVVSCRRLVFFIGLLVAVKQVGVEVTPILTMIGAAGFVIAMALQGTLSNFASGLLILWKRPYDIGDAVDAGGVVGVVESMNLFSTTIKTFDNRVMIVPNNSIWNGVITNITGSPTRRVDMTFGIGYDDSIDEAQAILERIVNEHPLTLKDPAPVVKFNELADSSMNFVVRPWSNTSDYWTLYWDVQRRVKDEFDKAGISIPYPQRDVHLYQESK